MTLSKGNWLFYASYFDVLCCYILEIPPYYLMSTDQGIIVLDNVMNTRYRTIVTGISESYSIDYNYRYEVFVWLVIITKLSIASQSFSVEAVLVL